MVLPKSIPLLAGLCYGAAAFFVGNTCAAQPANAAAARAQIMQSDEMLKALIWWEEYAASAKDGEKEFEALQARLATMPALELRRFLLKFQRERELARARRAAFEAMRRESVARIDNHHQWQRVSRESALDRSYYGHRHYFGDTRYYFGGYPRYARLLY